MPPGDESLPAYLRIPLGQVVRAWRQEQKLTLEELASAAGPTFTRGYLSQLENGGIQNPAGEKVAQVAAALKIDPVVLVLRQFPGEVTPTADDTGKQRAETPLPQSPPVIGSLREVDLSGLVAALSALPAARQQQYVDALTTLVARLGAGERG